jgi:hypothetical protein
MTQPAAWKCATCSVAPKRRQYLASQESFRSLRLLIGAIRVRFSTEGITMEEVGPGGEKILYKELSYRIIEACLEVHNQLGPGFAETVDK